VIHSGESKHFSQAVHLQHPQPSLCVCRSYSCFCIVHKYTENHRFIY